MAAWQVRRKTGQHLRLLDVMKLQARRNWGRHPEGPLRMEPGRSYQAGTDDQNASSVAPPDSFPVRRFSAGPRECALSSNTENLKSLSAIQTFVTVARCQSFTAASELLGISPSAVSKSVQKLEDEHNLKLFHRTTRTLSLTSDGEHLFQKAAGLLDQLQDLESEFTTRSEKLRGRLRLNCPAALGRNVLIPLIAAFAKSHPLLRVDLQFEDQVVDLAEAGIDVSVRTGSLEDNSQLIVTPFFQYQAILVAAPSLDPVPTSIEELLQSPTIGFAVTNHVARPWRLTLEQRVQFFRPRHRWLVDDLGALCEAAKSGVGVALIPSWACLESLQTGALVEILPHLRPPVTPVWLMHHDRRLQAPRIRHFIEAMRHHSQELTDRYVSLGTSSS